MRSYYVTPRRLTTTTFLWKTINMMMIINKDRLVEVPDATRSWLYSNWTKISPENAVMCMEYSEKNINYRWDIDPVQSSKIMDILITKEGYIQTALQNSYLREETLVTFLEGKYREMIEKEGKAKPSLYGYLPTIHYWTSDILSRGKTYQIEYIYRLYEANFADLRQIHYMLADHAKLDTIPDYIFSRIIPLFRTEDPSRRYDTGRIEAACFREAMRRQMLGTLSPLKVTVPSQPKPMSFTEEPMILLPKASSVET